MTSQDTSDKSKKTQDKPKKILRRDVSIHYKYDTFSLAYLDKTKIPNSEDLENTFRKSFINDTV